MPNPDAVLFEIRVQCERVIDECTSALCGKLTTEDDDNDSPDVREKLKRAVIEAKRLLAHLDASYDFLTTGCAELKEGVCLD